LKIEGALIRTEVHKDTDIKITSDIILSRIIFTALFQSLVLEFEWEKKTNIFSRVLVLRNAYKILGRKLQGKRLLKRPRYK
jgi:hypothetical protein